jgi:sugar phosphate isomerase/epimerase
MTSQIACQLYTLREFTKTPAETAHTMSRVKKIGYDAVQLSALGPIDPSELAKILDGEGLTACATHVPLDRLRDDRERVIDEHRLWKCRYTALGMYRSEAHSAEDWKGFAASFGVIARTYDDSQIRLGYHNHSHELSRVDAGKGTTALQLLLDEFDRSVWFEIDTYWIAHGGGDPIEWIRKVSGRLPCVHLKDMTVTPKREQLMAEVGEGNLNWAGILSACKEAGVEWYIVEQDVCQRDPFESIEISLMNLRAMGLQ